MTIMIQNLIVNCLSGFLINYFILNLVLNGLFGYTLKDILVEKLQRKDTIWFNKLLFIYFIISLFIILLNINNIVYLDDNTSINFTSDNVNISVNGDFLGKLALLIGSSGAFIVGSKIGYAAVAKYPIGFLSKTAISASTGSGFTFAWRLTLATNEYIEGYGKLNKSSNDSISVELNNVNLCSKVETTINKLPIESSNLKTIDSLKSLHGNTKNYLTESIKSSSDTNNSKILEMIEKDKKCSISEIFKNNGEQISDGVTINDGFINSPLEANEISLTIKNQVIELLGYNLTIHYIMLYLIIMGIFIFTIKFIIDSNVSTENLKKLPLGNYIYYFANKILSLWKKSNTFWIYFILFSLFIMMSASTYGIYGCLYLMKCY